MNDFPGMTVNDTDNDKRPLNNNVHRKSRINRFKLFEPKAWISAERMLPTKAPEIDIWVKTAKTPPISFDWSLKLDVIVWRIKMGGITMTKKLRSNWIPLTIAFMISGENLSKMSEIFPCTLKQTCQH